MSRPRHWIKLWVAYLTTPAHLDLSEGAFGLGPLLLLLATWDGEYDSGGWLLAEDGSPMTARSLARATHRDSIARLNSQLAELLKCGTLSRREDGALGFPKFGRWQETTSAKRTRVWRHNQRHGDAPCDAQTEDDQTTDDQNPSGSPPTPSPGVEKTAPVSPGFALPAPSVDRTEATTSPANDMPGEESPALLQARSAKPKRKGKPRKPRADYPEGLDEHLHAALTAACRSLTPPARGPQRVTDDMRDALRKLWAACEPSREDIDHVVAVRCAMTRRGEGYGSLTWDSICVASNFRRWLAERGLPSRSGPAPVSPRPKENRVVNLREAFAKREGT